MNSRAKKLQLAGAWERLQQLNQLSMDSCSASTAFPTGLHSCHTWSTWMWKCFMLCSQSPNNHNRLVSNSRSLNPQWSVVLHDVLGCYSYVLSYSLPLVRLALPFASEQSHFAKAQSGISIRLNFFLTIFSCWAIGEQRDMAGQYF